MAFFRIFCATMIVPPKNQCFGLRIRIRIGSRYNQVSGSGSGFGIQILTQFLHFNLGTLHTLQILLRQCPGSGSICFWASWIRVLPYLYGSGSGLLFDFLSLKTDVNAVFQIRIPRFRIRIQHFRQCCGSRSGIRSPLNPGSRFRDG
jgi:hypothetical protein